MIEELLDRAESDMREALRDPEGFEMARENPEKRNVDPDHQSMNTAVFDLENQTAEVSYLSQSPEERYICFKERPNGDLAFVRSKAVHDYGDTRVVSKLHYIVEGDELYRVTEKGLEDVHSQMRPLEVADEFEDLYRKALEAEEIPEESEDERPVNYSRDPVPPPEDEIFSV